VMGVARDELLTPRQVLPMLTPFLYKPLPAEGQTTFAAPRSWGAA
jgi:hypothetical protein